MDISQVIEKLKSDPALLAKYRDLTGLDAILAQAKADGFEVSVADVKNIIASLGAQSHGTLSEADLASVAGGDEDVQANKNECPAGGKHDFQTLTQSTAKCTKCGKVIRPIEQ